MFLTSNHKQRKILTAVLVAFVVVNVFGIILLSPTPAYAQWVVTDPITGANTTIRNITDFVRVVLIGVMGTALLNGLWYFSQRIAYDSAVWLASGGKGQDALVFQDGFGKYLENTTLDAVGEVIGSIDLPGFDLCRPPGLSVLLNIKLGIARQFQPPTPRCSWNDISANWDSFVSSATSDEVLNGLSNIFQPGQSGLEVAFSLFARSHEFSMRREMEAAEDRKEGGGFKPVTDIISGRITTPAEAVRQKQAELVSSDKEAREQTMSRAGEALSAGAFQLIPATFTIFMNTLLGSVTQNVFSGLYKAGPREERGPLYNPESSQKSVSGRGRAQAVFADWLTPRFVEVQNYDALTEFMACPGVYRGPNNCVIDGAFASIVRISESGAPLTVADAIKQGALHGDWTLIPSSDSGSNQSADCYIKAYCYSNLTKLRRARIIPIGWELAAEQGARLGFKPTLGEVVKHFYDCDPETGGTSDSHPWCHLIDPNWVLKYPVTQCRSLVKGPTLLAAETAVRADTCVDSVSCIAADDKGNCVSYGYCAREKNVWLMPGESCPAKYDSCSSFRKVNSDGRTEKEVFLLANTADFNGCTAASAGCSWYSSERTAAGTADLGWHSQDRAYFNRNVEKCSPNDDGCADLILKGAGVSKNLIKNSSFESGDPAAGTITFWQGVDRVQYSTDGSQSSQGVSAVLAGTSDGPLSLNQVISLEPETTYTISYYAKQAQAGVGNVPANARFTVSAGGGRLNMAGRTNCAFFTSNNVPDSTRMLLRFTPGDGYSRASCSFITPGIRSELGLVFYADLAKNIWIDAVQLEEGLEATSYRESGYPADAVHVSHKIPPEYLGCSGAPDDLAECANYALVCAKEDVNCELYTPLDGAPPIPAIVTTDKICPAICVGYSTFRKEQTRFESAEYPLYFIPTTGTKCEARNAGCDAFTNLENEAIEHFTYLRQCVRPNPPDTAAYYTWEGSDTTGFQLKTWNFLSGNPQAGEAGRPPAYRAGFTNYAACTREIFASGLNPDCREFYDVFGNISYRLYPELVVATPDCNRYRRSGEMATREECAETGGEWNAEIGACVYQGYPAESRSCPAEKVGCRAYTGNAGRNVRVLKEVSFEAGDTGGFAGILSAESIFVGGHSLETANETRVSVNAGASAVATGGTYFITFFAKGSGRPVIYFSGDRDNTGNYFANADFDLRGDWQQYTLGPVLLERQILPNEELVISGLGRPSFIDNFQLRQVSQNIYLIKNSWNTPAVCDQARDGTPFPQAMLGCATYEDTKGAIINVTGFDRLCGENVVGCRAVIDIKNSSSLEEERYNQLCRLPSVCADAGRACPCWAVVNGQEAEVCRVDRGRSFCRFNSVGAPEGATVAGVAYTAENPPDGVIVPEDATKYLVLNQTNSCRPEKAGCRLYGEPKEGVCGLAQNCASESGCACSISNDVVCKVANGSRTCAYKLPRYLLGGSGINYSAIVLKNDPSRYAETLCEEEHTGCEEWQKSGQGFAYFKDPEDALCEYQENVAIGGVNMNGWFKKGMYGEPCDPAFAVGGSEYDIRRNGDAAYRGWVGVCGQQYENCAAFIDPADTSVSYPAGKPYYLIKDKRLEEGNDCNGRVSQKEGCVLFKDTTIMQNSYSSDASYAVSAHDNYGLVPVSSCPNGAGCKRCRHEYLDLGNRTCGGNGFGVGINPCPGSVYGGSCVEDKDCKRDIPVYPRGVIPQPTSSSCIIPDGVDALANDSNVILKVRRDRACAEWLDCKTSVTVWDDSAKKFKKVCTQLDRCDAFVTTADGVKCANYKDPDYKGDLLTLDVYSKRDVSWYGQEYSGYSIPLRYPLEDLKPVDYDKSSGQDIRLAYVACEETSGADRNCNRSRDALAGACRTVDQPCGEPNSLGRRGRCITSGGVGETKLCAYGIDGSSVPAQREAQGGLYEAGIRRETATLSNALPSEECRAYPEQDSPFPVNVSNWTTNGLQLGRISGYQQANVCEKFAWRDLDNDGARDISPAWPDVRAELMPQNCECNYSKAVYNGKSFTKYFDLEGEIIPQGICQGGPRSGEPCAPDAKFDENKEPIDPANLKTCGAQTQGGTCQRLERVDKVLGQFGQCLEHDLSLSLNGIQDDYACLTWNPLGIVPGGKDIYNQFASAGYMPSGNTGRYFCLEAAGNGVIAGGKQSSYEAIYSQFYKRIFPYQGQISLGGGHQDEQVAINEGYWEQFITTKHALSQEQVGGSGSEKLVSALMKDIAALEVTVNRPGQHTGEEWKAALNNSAANKTNILSRLGKTGFTPAGREYWEIAFNIEKNQATPMLFTDESLIDKALADEANRPEAGGIGVCSVGLQACETIGSPCGLGGVGVCNLGYQPSGGEAVINRLGEGDAICANTSPGGMYGAVRAVFDNSQGKKLLGFWLSFCDGGPGVHIDTSFDLTLHFSEPCNIIAKIQGSNAAFTDRIWPASGYAVSDNPAVAGGVAQNLNGSVYGPPMSNSYDEFFMPGYGYENRNTPFGSAVSTQEPFGAEAWQITGPDGFGSPFTKYIPSAIDAGSPYGCVRRHELKPGICSELLRGNTVYCAERSDCPGNSFCRIKEGEEEKIPQLPVGLGCGLNFRCAGAPTDTGVERISLNEGQNCLGGASCPLEKRCLGTTTICNTSADCGAGVPCTGKQCKYDDGSIKGWCERDEDCLGERVCVNRCASVGRELCTEDSDCGKDVLGRAISCRQECARESGTCDSRTAYAECTDQFLPYLEITPMGEIKRSSPLEFIFAKSFGIWKWSGEPGVENQPIGYQKIEGGSSAGWDNTEEASLGEQPYPPALAAPDVSACEPQSQSCRVQGASVSTNDRDCTANNARDVCPIGWTCESRPSFLGNHCVPPASLNPNAISINNRVSGELRGAGTLRAFLRFYAWADHNTMPIVSRSVDWGDSLVVERSVDSRYKNHKPICSSDNTDDTAAKECQGVPGLTCVKQSDCPAGAGLCVPVGRCTSSRTRCSVDADCPLSRSGVERCSLSRFGNSPDACNEEYFEFEHTYVCTRELLANLPICDGSDLNSQNLNPSHSACARDLGGGPAPDACLFRPKVQVKDNWGFCNGNCPSQGGLGVSSGGIRCMGTECETHSGAWTGFGGFITVVPKN